MTDDAANPTLKKPAEIPDEPWIRDLFAANIGFEIRTEEDAAAICEGESLWCEYCGEQFPLWHPKLWAAHAMVMHARDLTTQQLQFFGQLAMAGLTDGHRQWLGMQCLARVPLRRRCRDLNFVRFVPGRIARPS